jgi:hypothetical protein
MKGIKQMTDLYDAILGLIKQHGSELTADTLAETFNRVEKDLKDKESLDMRRMEIVDIQSQIIVNLTEALDCLVMLSSYSEKDLDTKFIQEYFEEIRNCAFEAFVHSLNYRHPKLRHNFVSDEFNPCTMADDIEKSLVLYCELLNAACDC